MTGGGVLAVFAHPDDESLLAGGTLAACAKAGLDVGLLSLTRGELGEIADPALATETTWPRFAPESWRRPAGPSGRAGRSASISPTGPWSGRPRTRCGRPSHTGSPTTVRGP